jgi:hypothetical protein
MKSYWTEKKMPKTFAIVIAKMVVQPMKTSRILIKYPCLLCNQMDHISIDYPTKKLSTKCFKANLDHLQHQKHQSQTTI